MASKHELKIWPQFFRAVLNGSKTFELRKNDREFQSGDEVVLREWDPELVPLPGAPRVMPTIYNPKGFTGAFLAFRIGYVLPVDAERVVFSLLEKEEKI
jgi:hypothetical protein